MVKQVAKKSARAGAKGPKAAAKTAKGKVMAKTAAARRAQRLREEESVPTKKAKKKVASATLHLVKVTVPNGVRLLKGEITGMPKGGGVVEVTHKVGKKTFVETLPKSALVMTSDEGVYVTGPQVIAEFYATELQAKESGTIFTLEDESEVVLNAINSHFTSVKLVDGEEEPEEESEDGDEEEADGEEEEDDDPPPKKKKKVVDEEEEEEDPFEEDDGEEEEESEDDEEEDDPKARKSKGKKKKVVDEEEEEEEADEEEEEADEEEEDDDPPPKKKGKVVAKKKKKAAEDDDEDDETGGFGEFDDD